MVKKLAVLLTSIFLATCGVEEYYYIPQVPESNISRTQNSGATIDFPNISAQHSYAANYKIFYRIYTSNEFNGLMTNISNISSSLASDFNYFSPFANPANNMSIPSANTFRNRNYFELELEGANINSLLSSGGGTFIIEFPTGDGYPPRGSFDGGNTWYNLKRSKNNLISPEPDDLSFFNSDLLRNPIGVNADVAGTSMNYTYVSMYVVAVGYNPVNFTTIYSKPTHVNVFKLPD